MSPRLLIAEHSKLKGSNPSSALSATLVKVYCGAACARAAESIAPSSMASPATSANTKINRRKADDLWYVSILPPLPSGIRACLYARIWHILWIGYLSGYSGVAKSEQAGANFREHFSRKLCDGSSSRARVVPCRRATLSRQQDEAQRYKPCAGDQRSDYEDDRRGRPEEVAHPEHDVPDDQEQTRPAGKDARPHRRGAEQDQPDEERQPAQH